MEVIRLGVLGGTFNPIHSGHLHIASHIQHLFSLSQVHFVVATTPPHKQLEDRVSLTHRYAMVSLATIGLPSFVPSLVELDPPSSPFSVDTMAKLARGNPQALYFIAGGDSMLEVKGWRESEKLLSCYSFIFALRPGMGNINPSDVLPAKSVPRVRNLVGLGSKQLQSRIAAEEESEESRIYIVDVGAPDISATRIRSLASSGKRIEHMLPPTVYEYIQKLHLYGER